MRKFFVILSILALASCVHFRRVPAATAPAKPQAKSKEPITCSETFDSVFAQEDLSLTYQIGQFVMEEVRSYVEKEYPNQVGSFILKASHLDDCSIDRAMAFYSADIIMKLGYFAARIQGNTKTLSNTALAPAKERAKQLACYSECAQRNTLIEKPADCGKACSVDDKLAGLYDGDFALKRLAMACFQGVTDKTSKARRAEYQKQFERVVPPYLETLGDIQSALLKEIADDQRIRERLIKLRNDYESFRRTRPARTCPAPDYPWVKAAIDSNIIVRSKMEEGTAFYFRTGSQRYLATAVHVSEPDLKLKSQMLMQKVLGDGKAAGGARFDFYPGLVSIPSDIIMKREVQAGPALEVAGAEEVPQFDQKFFVAGYPTYAGGKFQIVDCTFYGFGPREANGRQIEAAYLLRCPGLGELKGVSGGPMLDERGRVWGVNSSNERYTSTVRVMPLSVGHDGLPKMAIQQTFVSDICYKSYEYKPYTCEVMPKMYREETP